MLTISLCGLQLLLQLISLLDWILFQNVERILFRNVLDMIILSSTKLCRMNNQRKKYVWSLICSKSFHYSIQINSIFVPLFQMSRLFCFYSGSFYFYFNNFCKKSGVLKNINVCRFLANNYFKYANFVICNAWEWILVVFIL